MSIPHLRTENLNNAEGNRFLSAGSNPLVTINLVVLNGEKYIRHCLEAILAQTYPHELIELNILDNASSDKTKGVVKSYNPQFTASNFSKLNLIEGKTNLGVWPGQEELLKYSGGKYVLALCVDVIIDKDFIKNAVGAMEQDDKIGALEAKIYKYDISDLHTTDYVLPTTILDTCGFRIEKSRRITNIGHGEEDKGQYDNLGDIFAVEGAAPFFKREAMEDVRINGEFCDHDYFWYGDDLDLAWRMNLFGWRQIFAPSVIAWHDRQTTKKLRGSFSDFLAIRHSLPLRKRQLEWKNIRFTIIKNDYIINILKDLPYALKREVTMLGYLIFFEPRVLFEFLNFIKLLPKMLRKRHEILGRAKVGPKEMKRWFT